MTPSKNSTDTVIIKKEKEDDMKSPLKKIREERGWTKEKSADLLETDSSVIGRIEEGKIRLPDRFYIPLRNLGVDPFKLAIEQEDFIEWRRKFYSCLRWGIVPPDIG